MRPRFHKATNTWRIGLRSYFSEDAALRSLAVRQPRRRRSERKPGPVMAINPAEYEALSNTGKQEKHSSGRCDRVQHSGDCLRVQPKTGHERPSTKDRAAEKLNWTSTPATLEEVADADWPAVRAVSVDLLKEEA